jgi:hypothetical protein
MNLRPQPPRRGLRQTLHQPYFELYFIQSKSYGVEYLKNDLPDLISALIAALGVADANEEREVAEAPALKAGHYDCLAGFEDQSRNRRRPFQDCVG